MKEGEKGKGEKAKKSKTPTPEKDAKLDDNDEKLDKAKISEYFGPGSAGEIMKFGNSRIES